MQTGKKVGMLLMDDSLLALANAGTIAAEEAVARAEDKQSMQANLGLA